MLPVFLLPGAAETPPVLSESTVRIHETNHSLASWKQRLTAVVAMGILPCDHSRRGTGEVRPSLSNPLWMAGSLLYKASFSARKRKAKKKNPVV